MPLQVVKAAVHPIRNPKVDIRDEVAIVDDGGRGRDTVVCVCLLEVEVQNWIC